MTREAFIRYWLANPAKHYDDHCANEMRDDLDKVIEWAQSQQKLNKPVFSVKTTDEEIWHWVEWLDKRCAFTEHQQDLIFFVIRQILKKEAGATAKGGPAEDQAPAPKAD